MKTRTMYMHTLDGRPASFFDLHGVQALTFASNGHTSRAVKLVPSLRQICNEQRQCLACDWRMYRETKPEYRGSQPSSLRYDYVLVACAKGEG